MIKLSIITINLNNKQGLIKTMESVLSQSVKGFEYIVIDGNSKDGSKEEIQKHESQITHWRSEPDSGIYNAMNKGIKLAKGEYLLFLNSGDYLESATTLEHVLNQLHTEDIVYANMIIDRGGKFIQGISPAKLEFEEMIRGTLWHPVSFIKRELFDRYGLYSEKYKIISDYEFFLRTIFIEKVSTRHIPVFVSVFNTEGLGSSPNHIKVHEQERYEVQTKLFHPGIVDSAMRFSNMKRSKPEVIYNFIKTKPFLLSMARMVYAVAKRFF